MRYKPVALKFRRFPVIERGYTVTGSPCRSRQPSLHTTRCLPGGDNLSRKGPPSQRPAQHPSPTGL